MKSFKVLFISRSRQPDSLAGTVRTLKILRVGSNSGITLAISAKTELAADVLVGKG
jgi:hypothetical protein